MSPSSPPSPRRRRPRLAILVAVLGLAALGTTLLPPAARADLPPVHARPGAARTSGIQLTSKTVVIPSSLVKQQLRSVSTNGSTYTFTSRTGALRQLRTGKVMLLTGLAARDVTKVATSHGHFVVSTKPASLVDVVRNGTLSLNKPIDFSKGLIVGGKAVPPEARLAARSVAGRMGLRSLARGAVKVKGTADGYSWSVGFTPTSTGVKVAVTIGRSSPVELDVTLTGTLDNLRTGGSIHVASGHVTQAQMVANNLQGKFSLAYSAKPISAFGLGQAGGIKIELPAEIQVPFAVGPVPFFLGVRVAFFASAGFSSFDQELKGEWSMSYDGNGGITTSSSGATSPAGALSGLAKIILNAVNAVNKGPLSFIFGAQMPQLQLGMGIKGFNVAGNVTLVGSTEIATQGAGCDTRKMEILGTAGASASFFGLKADFGNATLFDKTIQAAYPAACGVAP